MKEFDIAAKLASKGSVRNYHFGCVAKRKDGTIVHSVNERIIAPDDAGNHAEARVLKKAGRGACMWLVRVNKEGLWTMAKPCPRCQARIRTKGVHKVYYTVSPGVFDTWYPSDGDIKFSYKKIQTSNSTMWVKI